MGALLYVIPGIVLVGGLVFFHELGHFLAAKAFDVKVLRFSLGFGPRIWGFKRGETEYQLAALPLGGYVRMAGEDPTQELEPGDEKRSFGAQAPHRRAVIALAGPFVNLLLPVVVLFVFSLFPQKQVPPVIGEVIPGQPAEAAGMQPGDRVLSVDGQETPSFEEVRRLVFARPGVPTTIVVDRLGQPVTLRVTPGSYVERTPVGTFPQGMIGVSPGRRVPMVAVEPGSRAEAARLRSFDQVVAIDGKPMKSAQQLWSAIAALGSGGASFDVVRDEPVDNPTAPVGSARVIHLTLSSNTPDGPVALGLVSPDPVVRHVREGSAAWVAGLRPGDRLTSFNGLPIASEFAFARQLEALEDELVKERRPMVLGVQRGAEKRELSFLVALTPREDPYLGTVQDPEWGFVFDPRATQAEAFTDADLVEVAYAPSVAIARALHTTREMVQRMATVLGKLFVGQVPTKSLGGPLEMFRLAKQSVEVGIGQFISLFLVISINLGLFNLLPLPILDGFHVVVAFIEGVSRRKVPERAREIANYVGLVMLLMLMVLALRNDVLRAIG